MQCHFRMHNVFTIDRVIGSGVATLETFGTDSVISIETCEMYLDYRELFFFGWTPKATAKVTAESKTGT